MRARRTPGPHRFRVSERLAAEAAVVVVVERGLELDRKRPLGSGQRVLATRPGVVDAGHAVHRPTLQEGVRIGDRLQDARERWRAVREVQLAGQQVARETTDRVLGLGAAAVHLVEYCGHFCERVHSVIAKRDGQQGKRLAANLGAFADVRVRGDRR